MTTNVSPLEKLHEERDELRDGMRKALDAANDDGLRKIGNELAQVNRRILDLEAESQVDARNAYTESMHDALNALEVPGLTLSVKFDAANDTLAVVYTPTDEAIAKVKATIVGIDRPSTASKWAYFTDEQGQIQFEFGKSGRKPSSNGSGGNGTRSVGWTDANGASITLGNAFDACATKEQKTKLGTLSGGSATNAFKVKTVSDNGYKKV